MKIGDLVKWRDLESLRHPATECTVHGVGIVTHVAISQWVDNTIEVLWNGERILLGESNVQVVNEA